MSFEMEGEIGLAFVNGRLFISRDDLVASLDTALKAVKNKQVHETIQNLKDGLKNITV